MLKSVLLRVPMAYEAVQSLRDSAFLKAATSRGTYSQHGEDIQIMHMLVEAAARGPYVDVGCNHPFKLSNTFLLYLNGWRGMSVDPLPRFSRLHRRWRPEDRFFGVAVGETQSQLPLYEFESDVLSTLDSAIAAEYQRQGHRLWRTSVVRVERLDNLLAQSGLSAPLSILSIDIEGHELPALKSLDLAHWRPELICLEALTANGQRNSDAIDHISVNGYRVVADLGLNVVFQRRRGLPS